MDVHLLAVGAAAPDLRLDATDIAAAWGDHGRGTVAVCAPDEDTLTLAWSSATRALRAAGLSPAAVEGLWWGTTRPPFAEGPSHAYLAASLRLPATAAGALLAGSPHAGMEALTSAWDAVAAGTVTTALVVASDALRPGLGTAHERRSGAGAVALVLSVASGPARLAGRTTRSRAVLDRYRGDGEADTRDLYDPRLVREEVSDPGLSEVVAALRADGTPDRWSLPDLDGRSAERLADRLGLTALEEPAGLGDAGAASPFLRATAGLAETGTVAVLGTGGGRTTGVTVVVDAPVPGTEDTGRDLAGGRPASYAQALRSRDVLVPRGEPIPMGVPPGSAAFVRGGAEVLALHGARCVDCGTISTPPSVHPTCTACGGDKLESVPLERGGTVQTYVVNRAMPPPFVAPLPLLVVELDDGARLLVQGVGDGDDVSIGGRVGLELRRYAVERGAPVYGYKARMEGHA